MSSFSVRTSRGEYLVSLGPFESSGVAREVDALVVDSNVDFAPGVDVPRLQFHAAETQKSLAGVEEVVVAMNRLGLRRGSRVGAVGGGVIQDVVTMAASIYMRGIPWAYVPSTVMSMLDSCIGGKSSINAGGVKNLLGNIYPPLHVLVDVRLAQTLPIDARVAGYAEAAKICFVSGPEEFNDFLGKEICPASFGAEDCVQESMLLTEHVLKVKKGFIEADEFDVGVRLNLNFGHTFAHALEPALKYRVPHGVAVAIGMSSAIHFGGHLSHRSRELLAYIDRLAGDLPLSFADNLEDVDWSVFDRALESDKKGTASHLRFVLESASGSVALQSFDRTRATIDRARDSAVLALTTFRESLGSTK